MEKLETSKRGTSGYGHGMVLEWCLHFQQEMAVWMSKDRFYLQARVMVTISRVLSFASKKVCGYVSTQMQKCRSLWELNFCSTTHSVLGLESSRCHLVGWHPQVGVFRKESISCRVCIDVRRRTQTFDKHAFYFTEIIGMSQAEYFIQFLDFSVHQNQCYF